MNKIRKSKNQKIKKDVNHPTFLDVKFHQTQKLIIEPSKTENGDMEHEKWKRIYIYYIDIYKYIDI